MKLNKAKQKFIIAWGNLGPNWGINRIMAQIHAFLLVSNEPVSMESISENLHVSAGSVSTNMRALIRWGLVERKFVPNERKAQYFAEKDMDAIAKIVLKERKTRELDPILRLVDDLKNIEGNPEETEPFENMIKDVSNYAKEMDKVLSVYMDAKSNWLFKLLNKLKK